MVKKTQRFLNQNSTRFKNLFVFEPKNATPWHSHLFHSVTVPSACLRQCPTSFGRVEHTFRKTPISYR